MLKHHERESFFFFGYFPTGTQTMFHFGMHNWKRTKNVCIIQVDMDLLRHGGYHTCPVLIKYNKFQLCPSNKKKSGVIAYLDPIIELQVTFKQSMFISSKEKTLSDGGKRFKVCSRKKGKT